MKRPIGIFIAGVFLLVFGLLGLLLFSMGLLGTMATSSMQTTMNPSMRAVACVTEGVFAVASAFCCWVAVGLFRMRAWARYVSIVLAALGACFFGLSAVMLTLLRNLPLPAQNLPPHLLEHIFLLLAMVYFLLAAISLFWIVYFNRAPIRAAFFASATARRQGEDASGGVMQPDPAQHRVVGFAQIILWIVAVLFLGGGASMIVLMLLGTPMFVLGWMVTGQTALLIEVLWTCILLYAGLGLLFRWRAGWFLAVGLQLYSILSVGLLLLPGYAARLVNASQILAARLAPGADVAPPNGAILVASSAVGGLVALGILVALIRCRGDYLS
ncbi:MAG: hypothetical protein ACP5M4_01305 [Acidobacteriaceae bacterium]